MVFGRLNRTEQSIEKILELLKNRLDSATYEEDKLDALTNIYEQSVDSPVEVGTICLLSIISSIKEMDTITLQQKILRNIFNTADRKSFLDKICEDTANADIFMRRSPGELCFILDSIDSPDFYQFLSKDNDVSIVILSLLNEGYLRNVQEFLKCDEHICNRVVFDGVFEIILEKIILASGDKSKTERLLEYYTILKYLLSCSTRNKEYFLQSDLFDAFIPSNSISPKEIEVFNLLLDPFNRNYKVVQRRLCTPQIMRKALKMKMYRFIQNLFNECNDIFEMLIEHHLNIDVLLSDSDTDVDALGILECILRSVSNIQAISHSDIFACQSYKVNTLLHNLGLPYLDMSDILNHDLKNNKVSIDMIMFIIFTRDTVQDIAPYLNIENLEGVISDMCVLLYTLYEIDFKMPISGIRSRMMRLREFLCRNKITVDFINEMLINTIGEVIKGHTYYFPRKDYNSREVDTIQENGNDLPRIRRPEIEAESVTTDTSSKVQGLLDIFKPKDHERRCFDL